VAVVVALGVVVAVALGVAVRWVVAVAVAVGAVVVRWAVAVALGIVVRWAAAVALGAATVTSSQVLSAEPLPSDALTVWLPGAAVNGTVNWALNEPSLLDVVFATLLPWGSSQ
jgi:hypothetical protein